MRRRRCGKPVEATWKACAPAVGREVFFTVFGTNRRDRSFVVHLRTLLRLRIAPPSLEFSSPIRYVQEQKHVNIVRFNETINGRPYVIEVSPVGHDRWRAQIARTPGGTTALMPFYGATPDAAAQQLAVWLTRAAGLSARTTAK
jgi:hypothetical protein